MPISPPAGWVKRCSRSESGEEPPDRGTGDQGGCGGAHQPLSVGEARPGHDEQPAEQERDDAEQYRRDSTGQQQTTYDAADDNKEQCPLRDPAQCQQQREAVPLQAAPRRRTSHDREDVTMLAADGTMLAANRLRAGGSPDEQVLAELTVLVDVFATLPGFVRARVGRCVDDPDVWILLTEWDGVGTYRRALSSHAVKTTGYPVFTRIMDEPGAYEILLGEG